MAKQFIPEIVLLDIINNINNFESQIFNRLIPAFDSIEDEAKNKENELRKKQNEIFDPDIHDEASFEEDAFFENINYQITQNQLRQDFLNSCAANLFHMFEKELLSLFGQPKGEDILDVIKLSPKFDSKFQIDNDSDWKLLNAELRNAANYYKHGKGRSCQRVKNKYPHLLDSQGNLSINENHIRKYIQAMRNFWKKAIYNNIVVSRGI